jgi:ParB family transcriptional regulator, chromosome partitioning protein
VQHLLMAGDLDMGHARALLALPAAEQVMAAQEIVAKKLSVREAERLVARASQTASAPRAKTAKTRDITRLETRLADVLTAAVEIRIKRRTQRGEAGEIAIAFGSLDELNGLLEKLGLSDN